MDYEKAYKEALEKAKAFAAKYVGDGLLISSEGSVAKEFNEIFQELRESEDEGIRKSLIRNFTNQHSSNFPTVDGFTREQILSWLEKQDEQKPSNKVEPKFKAGDWVVSNEYPNCGNSLMRIVEVGLTDYLCRYYNGQTTYCHKFIDKSYHLWTIQDAKDGDIIVNDFVGGTCMAIFNSFTNDKTNIYCHLVNNDFCPKHGTSNAKWHPATKEQCDLLFQKMKEAGYKWDAEKKELKNIPNALEECEIEHIENGKYYYCIKDYYSGGYKKVSKGEVVQVSKGMSMMGLGVKANEYFIPVKQIVDAKPTWSEEDDSMIEGIKIAILDYYDKENADEIISWLESIKDRVQPQPTSEWSEEDLNKLANYLHNNGHIIFSNAKQKAYEISLLLRKQNSWKPNKEQMDTLKYACGGNYVDLGILESLYNDIKKL